MTDYLAEVGRRGRSLAVAALTIATAIFGLAFVGLIAMTIRDKPADADEWRIAGGSLFVSGTFAGVSLWMLSRLLRSTRSRNGITTMPLWFIELWGVVLACVLLIEAIVDRSLWMLAGSTSVVFAMLFVRRSVRNRLGQQVAEVESSEVCTDNHKGQTQEDGQRT
jgi:hypothetical protein